MAPEYYLNYKERIMFCIYKKVRNNIQPNKHECFFLVSFIFVLNKNKKKNINNKDNNNNMYLTNPCIDASMNDMFIICYRFYE
jgi:hypothetical protein